MFTPENEATTKATRRIQLNEEQILCNLALETGQYDTISDDEWVAMLEKVGSKAPVVAPALRRSDEE